MLKKKELFVIVDGNAIIHRAYHALPPLTAGDGTMVNAVYGFTSMMLKVINDLKPTYFTVSFDVAGGTFRDEIYEDYKATRVKSDQELYDQIPIVKNVVETFGIPIYEKEGFEADDVIGTITKQICDKYSDTVESMIVTGDMDILQLVDDCTKVYELRKGMSDIVIFDREKVIEKYGFGPEKVIEYKALRGDPSDNIPGIRGIGEKTAKQLIGLVGGIDEIYDDLQKDTSVVRAIMKPGVIKKLEEGEDDARMSRELATIKRDMDDISFSLESSRLGIFDIEKIKKLFSSLEFFSLLKRVPGVGSVTDESSKKKLNRKIKISTINKINFDTLLGVVKKSDKIFLVTTPITNDLLSGTVPSGLFFVGGKYYFLDFTTVDVHQLEEFLGILASAEKTLVGHDIKPFVRLILAHGSKFSATLFDTMIASSIATSSAHRHDLKSVALRELGIDLPAESNQSTLFGADPSIMAVESSVIADLHDNFVVSLEQYNGHNFFSNIEMPLIPILAVMENVGVKIDTKSMKSFSKDMEKRIASLSKSIYRDAGEEFNIASSVQLRDILFDKMKLPTTGIKKGKTGYSTSAPELEKLRGEHQIIEKIEEYREIAKLQNTYVDVLPKLINESTGRIHTTFNQGSTATGRLSSSDPNLQNIPIRTELGREVRKMFVAEDGYALISADYSQIDLRVVAHLAKDKKLQKIFRAGEDIHTATAALINDVPIGEVTKEMRRKAKEINFGVLYGMGAYGLAWRAKISQKEAKEFIEKYFENFSGVQKYLDEVLKTARKTGYVETYFGRRRYLPELTSDNYQLRSAAERMAINMPVQGTTSEIMKLAMINICKRLSEDGYGCAGDVRMVLQVHDEIVFEVRDGIEKKITKIIIEEMESAVDFSVPMSAGVKVGHSWGDMDENI